MTCECGRVKESPRAEGCNECKAIDDERYAAEKSGTVAEAVRRLLRHHYPDWLDGAEIRETVNSTQSSGALWDLYKSGLVEKRALQGFGMVYRLKQRRAA